MKICIKDIHLIVYDFDGVMTDNKVLVFEDGTEAVLCNRADGLAIQKFKKLGVPQIILSTEKNQVVKFRAKKLKIRLFQNITDKKKILISYCKKNGYDLKRVIFIGNDINDLEAMNILGYPVCPIDAHQDVKKIAKMILPKKGGDSVIRELLNKLIKTKKE